MEQEVRRDLLIAAEVEEVVVPLSQDFLVMGMVVEMGDQALLLIYLVKLLYIQLVAEHLQLDLEIMVMDLEVPV